MLPIILAACSCNDQGVQIYHEPPVVTILEPSDGSVFYEEQVVTFRAQIQTLDGAEIAGITHRWVAGNLTLCETTAVDADGIATCEYAFAEQGDYSVTVTAQNDRADRGTATVPITVRYNEPPTVDLTDPTEGDTILSTDLVVFRAKVSDTEDEASDLTVVVNSSRDGDLALPANPSSSGDWSGAGSLSAGQHLLTITVTDTAGKSAQDTAFVDVVGAPSIPGVAIDPAAALTGDSLQATITTASVDPDGKPVSYTYEWFKDGVLYRGPDSNPLVPAGISWRDEYWEVKVYPSNGSVIGNPGTASVTIGNRPPSLTSVTLTPTTADTSDDMSCGAVGALDVESDVISYRYAWYVDEALDSAETTATFPAAKTERGQILRCEITPFDSYDDGLTSSSPSIPIENAVPTTPGVEIEPTSPEPEDDLVCSVITASTDDDDDTISYRWEWWQNGSKTAYTSYVIDESYTSHGDTWECRVYAGDGVDESAYGSYSVKVADLTSPDAPYIDPVDTYRNEDSVDLVGDCEADCALKFYFSDSTGSWTETATCDSAGAFSHTSYVTRGYETDVYVTCTDSAGNTSASSNTVTTTACDPEDTYENTAGYGDSGAYPVDEWSALSDAGTTTITIKATALDSSDADWYVISTTDSNAADIAAKKNSYNFEVTMAHGSGTYSFQVFDGSYTTSATCEDTSASTYHEFDYYQDSSSCYTGSVSGYNNCTDFTGDWYIKVTRDSTATASCEYYELTIENGGAP